MRYPAEEHWKASAPASAWISVWLYAHFFTLLTSLSGKHPAFCVVQLAGKEKMNFGQSLALSIHISTRKIPRAGIGEKQAKPSVCHWNTRPALSLANSLSSFFAISYSHFRCPDAFRIQGVSFQHSGLSNFLNWKPKQRIFMWLCQQFNMISGKLCNLPGTLFLLGKLRIITSTLVISEHYDKNNIKSCTEWLTDMSGAVKSIRWNIKPNLLHKC